MKYVSMCLLIALIVYVAPVFASNVDDAQKGKDSNAVTASPKEVKSRTLDDACAAFKSSSDDHIWGFALYSKIAEYCGKIQEEDSEGQSGITAAPGLTPKSVLSGNIRVNDPSGDTGNTTDQNETSISVDTDMGKVCVVRDSDCIFFGTKITLLGISHKPAGIESTLVLSPTIL